MAKPIDADDKVVMLFGKNPDLKKKRKRRAYQRRLDDVLLECSNSGPPDGPLMLKIADDVFNQKLTPADFFAIYLWRKKYL